MEIHYRLTHPIALEARFRIEGLTVLFGPSGAGKTTLLKVIAGLLPAEGSPFEGVPVERRPVGYMPQHYALFPHLTALGNVAFPLAQLQRAPRDARAMELLRRMGIAQLAARYPRELSGGEQQRSLLPGPSHAIRSSCCSMSQPAPWTCRPAKRSRKNC